MAETHFTNLLIVVAVAFAAPFALGLPPRVRLPAVVLERVAGLEIDLQRLRGPTLRLTSIGFVVSAILSTEDRALCRTPRPTLASTA